MGYTRRDIPLLFDKVAEIPIDSIIGDRVDLVRSGAHYVGLCPFHHDTYLGSFMVTPSKNIWRCFRCGEGFVGDAVDFISLLDGIDRVDAMLKIAVENGLISECEYKKLSEPSKNKIVEPLKKNDLRPYKQFETFKTDPALLDKAYRAFINASNFTDANKNYVTSRNVKEPFLSDFFTFPHCTKEFMKCFGKELKTQGLSFDDLEIIPGFYMYENKWGFLDSQGVAFTIKNENGLIVGIQIRTTRKIGTRYIWFSSSFAQQKEKCKYGCSPGSQIDVVRTPIQKNHVICITEGKFKAIALAQIGLTTLSMQGVANWKSAVNMADKIIQNDKWFKNSKKTAIWICYDADARINEAVYKSMKNMEEEVKKIGYKCKFCIWPMKCGKGIDDVLNAGHINKIKKVNNVPLYRRSKIAAKTYRLVTKKL